MEVLYSNEIEDIYQNYMYELVLDRPLDLSDLEAITKDFTISIDESLNRTFFNAKINRYEAQGYLKSSRIFVLDEKKFLKDNCIDFMERIKTI